MPTKTLLCGESGISNTSNCVAWVLRCKRTKLNAGDSMLLQVLCSANQPQTSLTALSSHPGPYHHLHPQTPVLVATTVVEASVGTTFTHSQTALAGCPPTGAPIHPSPTGPGLHDMLKTVSSTVHTQPPELGLLQISVKPGLGQITS